MLQTVEKWAAPCRARPPLPLLARPLAWAALIGTAALVVRDEIRAAGLPEGVRAYREIGYRTVAGRRLTLDLYLPEGPAPAGGRPVVVAIHGGGWQGGSKDGFGRMTARLARHGLAVAAIRYRLARAGAPGWPGDLDDARAAVRWLRLHADEYGIDAGRVAALGASAGGHLAALLGTAPDGPAGPGGGPSGRVQAVINFYGPTDLAALHAEGRAATGPIEVLMGGPPGRLAGRYAAASPARLASADDAPMLLLYGADDRSVPPSQGVRLAEALRGVGVRAEMIVLPGAGHGFGLRGGGRDLVPVILAFLERAWNHKGNPVASAAGPLSLIVRSSS